ncbi:MAG TPA: SBBP repeat-containing protein, partial [Verrucomicrobiae bacterium]|nr:SBBP repeat-containing protein [Verrucomicrobiae bacterium]
MKTMHSRKFFNRCRSLRRFLCIVACGCLLPSIGHTQVSLAWTARYSGPSNAIDQARAIAVDASGNTYVTGGADRNGPNLGGDIVTVKYDADGNQVWTARYENPGPLADAPTAITLDGIGHVYVTGYSHGHSSLITAQDFVTLKYSPDGVQLWAARYSAPTNGPS